MPLIWNSRVSHLLGNNFGLAKRILESQVKKLNKDQLNMINNVFLEQIKMGIIEQVDDIGQIMNSNVPYSYLAHMPIFRPEKPSSPCRVVFLSNLSAKSTGSISHNQAMLAGPPLNRKLTTALLGLRFNKYVLCFDLVKAFLQIELNETDQLRLLFLWFKDITNNDYTLVTYKNVRLSFGLRCSPTILMLALYKILILDTDHDDDDLKQLKKQIYGLIYVDNGSISSNSLSDIKDKYSKLDSIFNPYQFKLQQFVTNNVELQNLIDKKENVKTEEETKLFGVKWNRISDKLATKPIKLNEKAINKRQILRSIAENFDPEGYNLPVLNRARLFMHNLQLKSELGWDSAIEKSLQHEWRKICNQANGGKSLELPRYIGSMEHTYDLIAFTDSSKHLYGTIIYLYNRDENTVSFIRAKNRVINKQLKSKSIPTLEFLALSFGTEVILEVFNELTGPDCVEVINICNLTVYTDSYVALNWLNNYNEMQKLKNLSIFTINKLNKIANLCKVVPVTFKFVAGLENPSDFVTREVSERKLRLTNYLNGPEFLRDSSLCNSDMIEVQLPNKVAENYKKEYRVDRGPGLVGSIDTIENKNLETYEKQLVRFSKFKSLLNSYIGQLRFINNIYSNLKVKNPTKFKNVTIADNKELRKMAMRQIIKYDQAKWYGDVLEYFHHKECIVVKDIPQIVTQLNLALDRFGIIRMKSKLYPRLNENENYVFPVLISPKGRLAKLIIEEYHERLDHANRYTVLSEIRKKIWIPTAFVLVRKLVSNCLLCKRLHGRTVQLNKNCYREFRSKPVAIPFRGIYVDYIGPFEVKLDNKLKERKKVWILIVCCLWSRAIKLHICYDYSATEFLKALQKQIYESGLFSICLSDSGTPILGGANKVKKYIFNNHLIQKFFDEQNVQYINFQSYPKGNHALGALIETCNRLVRKLFYGSVRNFVLTLNDLHFLTVKVCSILNKRPLTLKETLKTNNKLDVPQIITPEMLIFGRPLDYLNLVPETYESDILDLNIEDIDFDKELVKLKKVFKNLTNAYEDQFMQNLITQSIQKRAGFKPVIHKKVNIGDLVLIKDVLLKPHQYPLARVIDVVTNSLDEVTEVVLIKANKETVKRHVFSIIPWLTLTTDDSISEEQTSSGDSDETLLQERKTTKRKAAQTGRDKIKHGFGKGLY